MSKLQIVSAAQRDLAEAVAYYFKKDESLAEDFVARIDEAYRQIASEPHRFAKLETNPTDRDIRRLRIQRFPYLVTYELLAGVPVVLAIMHASRHPDSWRKRES